MDNSTGSGRELVFAVLDAGDKLERRLDAALSTIKGISCSEYQLLFALQSQHGQTATRVALAGLVGLTPSGVTRALKPLEKLGFVTTTKDARDARRSLATLTEQGGELVDDATGVVNDVAEGLTAITKLTADERALLLDLLADVAHG